MDVELSTGSSVGTVPPRCTAAGGFAFLSGSITGGFSNGNTFATLPAGCRPAANTVVVIACDPEDDLATDDLQAQPPRPDAGALCLAPPRYPPRCPLL